MPGSVGRRAERAREAAHLRRLRVSPADAPYDTVKLHAALLAVLAEWRFSRHEWNAMRRATQTFVAALDTCGGTTLEERWAEFQRRVWPEWLAGRQPSTDNRWAGGLRL